MNHALSKLLTDEQGVARFVSGLPEAFEIVATELPGGNPAIGILREQVLVGFLRAALGADRVEVATSDTQRGYDLLVDHQMLSIKTVTKQGGIKILWTVDQEKVAKEVADYRPDVDLLLIRIFWEEERRSVFYIPMEVQGEVRAQLGEGYLKVATGTNHRGIELSKQAIRMLELHPGTMSLMVAWHKQGLDFRAYDRWEKFWQSKYTPNDETQLTGHKNKAPTLL